MTEKQTTSPDLLTLEKSVTSFCTSGNTSRILVVDDDPSNQLAIKCLLTLNGYRVDAADNGSDAMKLLEENDYSLVLMDCMMPVFDGYDVTAAIRNRASNVKNHSIPVIALTGNTMQEDRDRCLASGMDDYMAKPIEIESLLAMIEKWVKPKVE